MGKNDLATTMYNKAGENFRSGMNCAEAIFDAFRELVDPGLDKNLVRMFTGYGGGLGYAGCMCGALAASVAVLGLLKGRTGPGGDKKACYNLAQAFHDRFEQEFGATCCRAVNPYPYETKEHKENCLNVTGTTAKMLAEYLQENNLLQQ